MIDKVGFSGGTLLRWIFRPFKIKISTPPKVQQNRPPIQPIPNSNGIDTTKHIFHVHCYILHWIAIQKKVITNSGAQWKLLAFNKIFPSIKWFGPTKHERNLRKCDHLNSRSLIELSRNSWNRFRAKSDQNICKTLHNDRIYEFIIFWFGFILIIPKNRFHFYITWNCLKNIWKVKLVGSKAN